MQSISPLISIVVPIYNVEEYLPRCLDSIVAQTYQNIEIMLVDDGSPDGAGSICDEYAAKDSRIRVFHIPNGGVAKARQLGVESSTGEYIVFVDPDDWLPLDSVEVLYAAMTPDVDLVIGNFAIHNSAIQITKNNNDVLSGTQLTNALFNRDIIHGSPWCKLYRKKLFTPDSFPNMQRSQDWLMNIEVAMRIRSAKTISHNVYNYYIYRTSVSHRKFPNTDYWGHYLNVVENILNRNNKFTLYEQEYYRMSLMIIKESIANRCFVSLSDDFVRDTYNFLKNQPVSFLQKLFVLSLPCTLMQMALFVAMKVKLWFTKLYLCFK